MIKNRPSTCLCYQNLEDVLIATFVIYDRARAQEETEAAALFLSAFSWGLNLGVIPVLKEGGQ